MIKLVATVIVLALIGVFGWHLEYGGCQQVSG